MHNQPIISPSPHIHSGNTIDRKMITVLLALLPAWLTSIYFFGVGALWLTLICMAACTLFQTLVECFLLKVKPTYTDGSALLTGLLLAMNLPPTLPWWIAVIGSFAAIIIGKMAYGGLGNNIFNPALVGRVFLLISFPAQMTTWAMPHAGQLLTDGETGATLLSALKEGVAIDFHPLDYLWGNRGGSLGETSALALCLGVVILLVRRVITWHIPVATVGSAALVAALLHWYAPTEYAAPLVHLLSGGLLLGAFFMATDYVTSPMSHRGMLLYGAGIGTLTLLIRSFGSYPEGVSFAILIMNALTPLINTYLKPRRFGAVRK